MLRTPRHRAAGLAGAFLAFGWNTSGPPGTNIAEVIWEVATPQIQSKECWSCVQNCFSELRRPRSRLSLLRRRRHLRRRNGLGGAGVGEARRLQRV
jgi:hypothetical protein